MTFSVPKDHPRYHSLVQRHRIEDGVLSGVTTPTGLIAHGRGEAYDYLLGERTHDFSESACRAAAAALLNARKAVISVNGNTAMLVAEEMIDLSNAAPALLEINIFHESPERRDRIAERFRSLGADILGTRPDAVIPGLSSARAQVDSRGMLDADVVLVSLEDGDRTAALVAAGKTVIAIDLNPLSRTPQTAQIAIVDNVSRAFPLIQHYTSELRSWSPEQRARLISEFDNRAALVAAEAAIRKGFRPPDANEHDESIRATEKR
ncbi:MAG: phosphopantothenate/pantothenate synthetase [Bdellovibrionota bacterium]